MEIEPSGRPGDGPGPERGVLLAVITVLLGVSIALIAGIVAFWAGATVLVAITAGGAAFVGTVGAATAILGLLGLKGRG